MVFNMVEVRNNHRKVAPRSVRADNTPPYRLEERNRHLRSVQILAQALQIRCPQGIHLGSALEKVEPQSIQLKTMLDIQP